MELPSSVNDARHRAGELGFELSSEPEVGRLIAFLASGVPAGGRILKLEREPESDSRGSFTASAIGTMWQ